MEGKQKAILVIVILIVAGLGSYTILFRTYFHQEYLGSDVTYAYLEIEDLNDARLTIDFDNDTNLLYSIDVVTSSGVSSYGRLKHNDFSTDGLEITISCDAEIESMNVTLRSDVDFGIDVVAHGKVDAHITYSNNVTLGRHGFLRFWCVEENSSLVIEVHEDCFVAVDEVYFEVHLNPPSTTLLMVDLPHGYDGKYRYDIDNPPTILDYDGWVHWPTKEYATWSFLSSTPTYVFTFYVHSSESYAILYD